MSGFLGRLKTLIVDPIENGVCIVRASGLAVLGTWTGHAGWELWHHTAHLSTIADSGYKLILAVAAAIRVKHAFKPGGGP